jgi:pimeloyl-ACP methyl ester carboxylesterase
MKDPASGLLLAALLLAPRSEGGELRRRADRGFRIVEDSTGVSIRGLKPGSAAERAGLRDGDRVIGLDGHALDGERSLAAIRRGYRGGDRIALRVTRDGQTRDIALALPTLPEERIPGCVVRYGSVQTSRGDRVRTVFTRPERATGRVPTLVFIPWLSCDPVEGAVPGDGWMEVLRALAARSGWGLYRVEKPGVGDSEGPDCGHNDLEADLSAFRAALADVHRMAEVDPARIVLFGGSIGGALAPVLARDENVAGLIVSGGFSRTWLEHMLDLERRRLELEGQSPSDVHRAMRGYADFYALYLNERLTPAEVLSRRPDLAALWYDAADGQYGRPAAYYHQVQSLNVEEAWAAVEVPVLILHGEYDWIMSRAEAEHAAAIVNARHPGLATVTILPRTDHNFAVYETPLDAYRDRGGSFDAHAVEPILAWLRQRASRSGTGRP